LVEVNYLFKNSIGMVSDSKKFFPEKLCRKEKEYTPIKLVAL